MASPSSTPLDDGDGASSTYTVLPFVELNEDRGHVTALHADGAVVVVGTSSGMLLRFAVDADPAAACRDGGEDVLASAVCCARKSRGSDARVRQLCVLGERGVVLALCGGLVSVRALDSLEERCVLNNAKTRSTSFCVSLDEPLPRAALYVAATS